MADPEALAVTSLAATMGSFFVTTLSQYLIYLFAGRLGLNDGGGLRKQVASS